MRSSKAPILIGFLHFSFLTMNLALVSCFLVLKKQFVTPALQASKHDFLQFSHDLAQNSRKLECFIWRPSLTENRTANKRVSLSAGGPSAGEHRPEPRPPRMQSAHNDGSRFLLEWEDQWGPQRSLPRVRSEPGQVRVQRHVWSSAGFCLEHFDQVSPKSQTMPAVPGKAGPGLLRICVLGEVLWGNRTGSISTMTTSAPVSAVQKQNFKKCVTVPNRMWLLFYKQLLFFGLWKL